MGSSFCGGLVCTAINEATRMSEVKIDMVELQNNVLQSSRCCILKVANRHGICEKLRGFISARRPQQSANTAVKRDMTGGLEAAGTKPQSKSWKGPRANAGRGRRSYEEPRQMDVGRGGYG